ncbi:MAG: FHA domain-containing protein [Nanoarchaeota archaeon]|nr:FHA domain-containing protein [Nanoarchaeota archaeon]
MTRNYRITLENQGIDGCKINLGSCSVVTSGNEGRYVIGRESECDLHISHIISRAFGISRRHAIIEGLDGIFALTPHQDCSNGVYFKDRKLNLGEYVYLEDGELIGLGPIASFAVRIQEESQADNNRRGLLAKLSRLFNCFGGEE